MSESPEPSVSAPAEHPTGSPAAASPQSEEKHDINSNEEQVEETENETKPSDEPERQAKTPESVESPKDEESAAPPLPDEALPPLPEEAPPATQPADDGWEPVWEPNLQAYYFYNRFTEATQWENPRVPEIPAAPGTETIQAPVPEPKKEPVLGGYNPAIHGDYDPTADYARQYEDQSGQDPNALGVDPTAAYAATGTFNRFTGRWQADAINPENHNDENKSRRQMNAFFDVDAAANSHDGRSLRAERSSRKLTKAELKQFKEKRREKKEEKRRAWLRD
ncbi:uncharacterized protein N7529_003150 [Penicillium soppii]|uniref:uncharacterized protein n=1 Tax=Penicillium soppii TaxID=69789 RepID=UPI002548E894|nr:uncharacterized protein N7529_003150 [Penicillium soppii]KAJ5874720.1 hypothetical protein N7529_003150 [Penicillium soppii]